MKAEHINEINRNCPDDQGIFKEPYGIPVDVKGYVVYCRYETGGYTGGSCWESSNLQEYEKQPPKDRMKVLDLVLVKLKPNITYLQFKQIEQHVYTNEQTDREYYGNSTDYKIEYIVLSELEALLQTM